MHGLKAMFPNADSDSSGDGSQCRIRLVRRRFPVHGLKAAFLSVQGVKATQRCSADPVCDVTQSIS